MSQARPGFLATPLGAGWLTELFVPAPTTGLPHPVVPTTLSDEGSIRREQLDAGHAEDATVGDPARVVSGPCPGCGAADGLAACTELFHHLLALDQSRMQPWGPLHGAVVPAFYLQHSQGSPRALDPMLDLLQIYLRDGAEGLNTAAQTARGRNSHRTGAPYTHAFQIVVPGATDRPAPASFRVTISDVAVDGSFPAAGHGERMRAWAAATVEEWTSQP